MKVLLTGGGGFLGKAIVKQLLQQQHDVVTFQRGDYPELREWGAITITGDLRDAEGINAACEGCDAVFHVAAKAGVWGDPQDYFQANVIATRHVIAACKKHRVPYLVYTSTPSVVFDGNDEEGVNETLPYTSHCFNSYQETKIQAERMVLEVNQAELQTIALRPHLIWGPDDPHLVPRIIARAKAGKLKLVGDGLNKVDSCYIDNAAQAHVLALTALQTHSNANGKAYFISNDEPITMQSLINKILTAAELPPVKQTLSTSLAYRVGAILECLYRLIGKKEEPIMTRFVARQLATHHWFDLSAAKKDLNYFPTICIDEGMERLSASLKAKHS